MAEITNFEIVGSNKSIAKVEASLDNGRTYGTIWEAVQHTYTLVPTEATDVNGDGTQYALEYTATVENIDNYWNIYTPFVLYEDGVEVDTSDLELEVEGKLPIIHPDGYSNYFGYVPPVGESYVYDDMYYIEIEYKGKTIRSNPIQIQINAPIELLSRDVSIIGSSINLEYDSYGYVSETYVTHVATYENIDSDMEIYFKGTEDENMDGITIEDSDGHTSIQRCYPYEYISDTECKWKLLLKHDGYYEGTDSVSREIIVNIPSSSTYKSVTLIINESIY